MNDILQDHFDWPNRLCALSFESERIYNTRPGPMNTLESSETEGVQATVVHWQAREDEGSQTCCSLKCNHLVSLFLLEKLHILLTNPCLCFCRRCYRPTTWWPTRCTATKRWGWPPRPPRPTWTGTPPTPPTETWTWRTSPGSAWSSSRRTQTSPW